jgi:selT/selW/selH-like putative selenoprotein
VSLRKQLEQKTGTAPKLKIGKPGSFDVFVDGRLVWSKEERGKMPTVDEIVALLPQSS